MSNTKTKKNCKVCYFAEKLLILGNKVAIIENPYFVDKCHEDVNSRYFTATSFHIKFKSYSSVQFSKINKFVIRKKTNSDFS